MTSNALVRAIAKKEAIANANMVIPIYVLSMNAQCSINVPCVKNIFIEQRLFA